VNLDRRQRSAILNQVIGLKHEHRKLDEAIARMELGPYVNELEVRRMKKRKLALKDEIMRLESLLIPDRPA
jgi:hypothetical protein